MNENQKSKLDLIEKNIIQTDITDKMLCIFFKLFHYILGQKYRKKKISIIGKNCHFSYIFSILFHYFKVSSKL